MIRRPWAFHGKAATAPSALPRSHGRLDRLIPPALAVFVLVIACLVIALATGIVSQSSLLIPPQSPSPVVSQVLDYALTWRGPAEDPSIALPSGIQVKSSNYRGVPINGVTYYYNLAPRPSYDPLARGQVTAQQIEVVAVVGDPPDRVMIYSIK